jgi:hypothetical protein
VADVGLAPNVVEVVEVAQRGADLVSAGFTGGV